MFVVQFVVFKKRKNVELLLKSKRLALSVKKKHFMHPFKNDNIFF